MSFVTKKLVPQWSNEGEHSNWELEDGEEGDGNRTEDEVTVEEYLEDIWGASQSLDKFESESMTAWESVQR